MITKMSTLQIQENTPVDGDQDLSFLVSLLDKQDKIEFVEVFSDDFQSLVQEGRLSKTGLRKLLSGYAPADERLLQIAEMDHKAKEWIARRVQEKAKRALEIIERMKERGEE
ncbi:hypothetical protein HS7_20760 [Sulfolobales archaeon HS-7]|nr:hypothetical protein HS7_20760 [Sulfolobales archaeon HS-7]